MREQTRLCLMKDCGEVRLEGSHVASPAIRAAELCWFARAPSDPPFDWPVQASQPDPAL